ncbi:hypothetical protein [Solimonas variicoloris]|uniref:hypothetical protein n=1 Tax=Solimonas variicoloris TaxID=254408 RepID=UPI00039D941C|nr:hypothetical protein [Solimonas variicoloris]
MSKSNRWMTGCALLLAACGGGGNDGGEDAGGGPGSPVPLAQPMFEDYAQLQDGPYLAARQTMSIANGFFQSSDCGALTSATLEDRAAQIRAEGGMVSLDSEDAWCATSERSRWCLRRGETTFVQDHYWLAPDASSWTHDLEIVMAFGIDVHRAYFSIHLPDAASDNDRESGRARAAWRDVAAPTSGECQPPAFELPDDAIDGVWRGARLRYEPASGTLSEAAGELRCTGGVCTLSDGPIDFITGMHQFGSWFGVRAQAASPIVGLSMTSDARALAVWTCPSPGVSASRIGNCTLYALTRE